MRLTTVPFSVSQHCPPRGPSRSAPPAERRRDTDSPPKATLFCPSCGHRDHVAGEWDECESGGDDECETAAQPDRMPAPGGHLCCPGCGTTVTAGSPEDRAPAPGLTPSQLAVRTGLALSPVVWVAGVSQWWSMMDPLHVPGTAGSTDR